MTLGGWPVKEMRECRKLRPDYQKGHYRLPETIPPIPGTFENVIKAPVDPVREPR